MFKNGTAMSSAPIISGIRKLPNAPAQNWDDHKKDHDGSVHGHEHRISFGSNLSAFGSGEQDSPESASVATGNAKLPANTQSEHAADKETKSGC